MLSSWNRSQPQPRGEVLSSPDFQLAQDPDTSVAADIAYISAVTARASPDDQPIDGAPVLAVEILSPYDKYDDIAEKVETYVKCGVKLVWVVDPRFRTITVFRPDAEAQLHNVTQEISGEPHLPGFRVPLAQIFA